MDNKFSAGLASQVMDEFDSIRKLQEEFRACGAEERHIKCLRGTMQNLLDMYFELS